MDISQIYTEEDGNQYVIHRCDNITQKDGWLIGTCSHCPGFVKKIKLTKPYIIEMVDPEQTLFQDIQIFHSVNFPIVRTLKDLTPNECVIIASIICPEYDWNLLPNCGWDGFDLVPKILRQWEGYKTEAFDPIIQIDYRPKNELPKDENRIRLYIDLEPVEIHQEKLYDVFKVLDTINVQYKF